MTTRKLVSTLILPTLALLPLACDAGAPDDPVDGTGLPMDGPGLAQQALGGGLFDPGHGDSVPGDPPPGANLVATRGPLRISSGRSTVFEDAGGRAVWLTGMTVAGGNDGKTYGGWPLVSTHAIDDLSAEHGNFVHIRLGPYIGELEGPEFAPYPSAGGGKYDLDHWNPAYWQRVKDALGYARSHGVYVEVDLIDGWAMKVQGRSPWHASRNVNGAAYACDTVLAGARHVPWLNKVVDEIGDYDNVIFQVGNETSTCGQMGSGAWESLVVSTVEARLGPGRPRLFATNSENGAIEAAGYIDYVNRHNPSNGPPSAIDLPGTKPAGVNEYGDGAADLYTAELWEALVRGTYLHYWWGGDQQDERLLTYQRIGWFLNVLGRTDFAGFEAQPIVNARLVGRRNQELLGYLPGPGSIHINDLGGSGDLFDARWIDPIGRLMWASDTVPGGVARDFVAPTDHPGSTLWVLHVNKRSTPRGVWLDETFDGLANGPLHGQHGWVMENDSPAVQGGVVVIDPPAGTEARIGRDVPIQRTGKQRLDVRVLVTGATAGQDSMAKLEVRTEGAAGLAPKFQIYFGTRMRVVHTGAPAYVVQATMQDQWYRIRCDLDMDASPNRMNVYVDDVLAASGLEVAPGPITDVVLDGFPADGAVKIDEVRAGKVRFYDVPGWHPFYDAIETVAQLGITGGCSASPPLFCPDQGLTRAQAAVFLLLAEHGAGHVPPDAAGIFQDVPALNDFARWVEELYNEHVTGGCALDPLRYCPNDTVTREQVAVFLLRAFWGSKYVAPDPTGHVFNDVPATSGYARWIEELHAEGVAGGCSASPPLYCPGDPVTRGQMAVFTVAMWDLP
jgi:hypothetical protein